MLTRLTLTADCKAEIGKVLLHLRRPAYLLYNLRLAHIGKIEWYH